VPNAIILAPFGRACPGLALLLAAGLFALAMTAATAPVQAATKSVDCADLSISFDSKTGYDLSCETDSTLLADMDGSLQIQHLEATAGDSSNFVDALYYDLMGRVTYTATDLRSNFQNLYGHMTFSDWQSGRAVSNLATAEFKADLRGLPSRCVAFQRLGHRDWGGYKKIMIGIACSQTDIDQAYDALKHLYLPN
jgi:hypothetical protein